MTEGAPTLREQFLYTVAQEFSPDDVIFTGFHWPTVGARVARRLHAPDFTAVYEAGIVNRGTPNGMPTSTTEVGAFDDRSEMYSNTLDSLQTYLKSGRIDGAVVEAATVDRFGNVNSTCVGEYENPIVRLPGPGGANDILAYGKNVTLVNGSMDTRRYQNRVSYVSSPGHLDDDGRREGNGYEVGTGPKCLLCPLGRFVFDDTGRTQLEAIAPGVSIKRVREITGWPVPDQEYKELDSPDKKALSIIREEIQAAQDRGYNAIKS
jgi:glutaconate CoA-transferase subunit B